MMFHFVLLWKEDLNGDAEICQGKEINL